ncbi:hypothetical protein Busp01_54190 [Trinickia caryophylli]|nr:hypothetical protein Busp01_54190 [Trinickia caryophylli]
MLVVLVIAGLLVSFVALAPTRNRRTDLAEEAARLAAMLDAASDEAQLRASPIAWEPSRGGYRFLVRTAEGRWAELRDGVLRPYRWQAWVTGVSIHYTGGEEQTSRVVLGEESVDSAVTITLSSDGARASVAGTGFGSFEARRP